MSANGYLNTATLTPIENGMFLEPRAAAAWVAAKAAVAAELGIVPVITVPDGAYRTFAQQVAERAYWTARGKPGNAAVPGYSNHGLGLCVDINNISRFNLAALERVMARFGYTRTVPAESWHFQHDGTTLAGETGTPITTTKEEDEEMAIRGITWTENGVAWAAQYSDTGFWSAISGAADEATKMNASGIPFYDTTASVAHTIENDCAKVRTRTN